jgi:MFS family permease
VGNAGSLIVGGLTLKWLAAAHIHSLPLVGLVEPYQVTFIVIGAPGLLLALMLLTVREPARREMAARGVARSAFPELWGNRRIFIPIYLTFVLNYVAGLATGIWGPVVFMRAQGMAPADVGILVGLVTLTCGLFSAPLSGWLSDLLAKRRPSDGRFILTAVALPIAAACAIPYLFSDSWTPLLFAFIASTFLTNFIGTTAYSTLQELVPNELRGQVVAVYLLLVSFFGYGLAPTVVALITDYGLHDPRLLHISLAMVTVPAFLLGGISAWWGIAPYRQIRGEMLSAMDDQA